MSRLLHGLLPGTGRVRVALEQDRISGVDVVEPDGAESPPAGEILLPGLIDLQVNGYAGIDFNAPGFTVDDVRVATERLWSVGVTGFCPTVITGPHEQLVDAMGTIRRACTADDEVAASVVGTHLEGPWISPVDGARGAHPLEHVRAPDLAELHRLTEAGDLAILTVAPEAVGASELIAAAVRAGTLVSIGHSAAEPEHVRTAVESGAILSTHLGNGVPGTLPRHPNLVWEQLAEERLVSMLIADGHHLDLSTLVAMSRAKGPGRWLLVSDVTALGGMPVGRYETRVGGLVELRDDGRLGMVGTGYLAGAARTLLDGVGLLLGAARLPAAEVVSAASGVPARVLGARGTGRGDVVVGGRADLVRALWDPAAGRLEVLETISRGRTVWERS